MEMFIILGIIGGPEIILIVVVVLLLFGGKKIPELMKGFGQGISEFKKASKGTKEEVDPYKTIDLDIKK